MLVKYMKNIIGFIFLSLLSSLSFGFCKETEPGIYESSNWMKIPPFFVTQGVHRSFFYLTNISDAVITVSIEFTDKEGDEFIPGALVYSWSFSASNSPIASSPDAVLLPGQSGRVEIVSAPDGFVSVGRISWHAEGCVYEGLIAKLFSYYVDSTGRFSDALYVNGGMPF